METTYSQLYGKLETDHWWWRARREIVTSQLCARVKRGGSLLEIGCGAGTNLAHWKQLGFRCEGVEPDDGLRSLARERTGLDIRSGTLPDGLPQLGRFDAVLLLDVLEHVQDDAAALHVASKLVVPGGWIFINVPALPALWSIHDEINHHHRRYLRKGLRTLVASGSTRVALLRYWGCSLAPLAWAARCLPRSKDVPYTVPIPSRWINCGMQFWTQVEHRILTPLPFVPGLSLLAVAQK